MVKVQSVAKAKQRVEQHNEGDTPNRHVWADIAANYPQYTLKEASQLSGRDIALLLKAKQRQRAEIYLNLVQIVAAPNTKDGEGVSNLMEVYKNILGV